jgi:hypothetical protein
MKKLVILFIIITYSNCFAQIGVNTATPYAQLELKSINPSNPENNEGILIPKIDIFPTTNPTVNQDGMLVYLTTANGSFAKGFYYWNNASNQWIGLENRTNWSNLGDNGTNGLNFLGTTNNQDLVVKTDDVERMKFLKTPKVEIGTSADEDSARLEVSATNKGVLIPRIALTGDNDITSITSPSFSLLVYNTSTITGANAVQPSFYYWNGTKWIRIFSNHYQKAKYYEAVGTTTLTSISNRYSDYQGMRITLTPNSNIVFVNFSASGVSDLCSESPITFQLLVDNIPVAGWQCSVEMTIGAANWDLWSTNINIPVSVTKGVSHTFKIAAACNCTDIRNIIGAGLPVTNLPNGERIYNYRILSIVDPNNEDYTAGNNSNQTNSWALTGNSSTNTATDFIGSTDNRQVFFKSGNFNGFSLNPFDNSIRFGTIFGYSKVNIQNSTTIQDGNQTINKVYTSNAAGTGTWQNALSNPWKIFGNAIDENLHFLGTSNNQSLVLKTNNLERIRIRNNGLVGVRTSTPLGLFDVESTTSDVFYLKAPNGQLKLFENDNANKQWIFDIDNGNYSVTENTGSSPFTISENSITNTLVLENGVAKNSKVTINDGTEINKTQHGTMTVGGGNVNSIQRTVTLTFPTAFTTIPNVVAMPINDSTFLDKFNVTMTELTATSVKFIVYRLDTVTPTNGTPGWGQNLKLSWWAFE